MILVFSLALLSAGVFAIAFHVARDNFSQVSLIFLLLVCGWLLFVLSTVLFFRMA